VCRRIEDKLSGYNIFETVISTPVAPMPADVHFLIEKIDAMTEPLVRVSIKFKR
jgi:hypothetical protein